MPITPEFLPAKKFILAIDARLKAAYKPGNDNEGTGQMCNEISKSVCELATAHGYTVYYKALRYVRGWPQRSTRPYQLQLGETPLGSFATEAALERALRGRAGC